MPRLEIPKVSRKIRVTEPAQIPYPSYVAGRAYAGLQQLGAALANIGRDFMNEIYASNINKEVTETWGVIEKERYEFLQGLDENTNPKTYSPGFIEKIKDWGDLIEQQETRKAKEILKARLANNAWGWHDHVIRKGREQLRLNALDSYAITLEKGKDKIAIPQRDDEDKPVESFVESLRRTISDVQTDIETAGQNIVAGQPIRPESARQADLDEVKMNIVMNTVYGNFSNLAEGSKWLKKNYKKLDLNFQEYKTVIGLLENRWTRDEAIQKIQQEVYIEQTTMQIWDLILENDFDSAQQFVNASNLPIKKEGGKLFWTDYIRKKQERIISGKDVIDSPDAIYDMNEIIDDLWMGDETWTNLIISLAAYEKGNNISSPTANNIVKNAKTTLKEQQKQEWMAVKAEAKARIIQIPGPDDPDFTEWYIDKTEEQKGELGQQYLRQIQRYNDFRMEFVEWINRNPEATFYEYQEQRLELLYGKYTNITDELLQKRVETVLEYDIGDEITVDGVTRIYIGGNRWKLKKQ